MPATTSIQIKNQSHTRTFYTALDYAPAHHCDGHSVDDLPMLSPTPL